MSRVCSAWFAVMTVGSNYSGDPPCLALPAWQPTSNCIQEVWDDWAEPSRSLELPLDHGITRKELDEVCRWLGPQAELLSHPIRLVEVYAGSYARLSAEVRRRGHGSLSIGRSHGQELNSETDHILLNLIKYIRPEDVWVAVWPLECLVAPQPVSRRIG